MKKASQTEIFSNHIKGVSSLPKPGIRIDVDCTSLDEAIEKANRLIELLREAKQIIDSLSKDRSIN